MKFAPTRTVFNPFFCPSSVISKVIFVVIVVVSQHFPIRNTFQYCTQVSLELRTFMRAHWDLLRLRYRAPTARVASPWVQNKHELNGRSRDYTLVILWFPFLTPSWIQYVTHRCNLGRMFFGRGKVDIPHQTVPVHMAKKQTKEQTEKNGLKGRQGKADCRIWGDAFATVSKKKKKDKDVPMTNLPIPGWHAFASQTLRSWLLKKKKKWRNARWSR